MRSGRRNGVGAGEIFAFLALVTVGVVLCLYLNQKPQIVERTIVIEKETPAPPTPPAQPKPAPVVTPPVAVKASFQEPGELPEVLVVVTPPPPACIAIGKKLRIALQAAVQADSDLAAAKQAALDRLHQSSDYQSLKTDLKEKKKAKDDALNALQQDNSAGNDTDQDAANVRAASLAWATQSAVLARLENETVAQDDMVNQKLHDLKDIRTEIASLQKQMEDYIFREIVSVSEGAECRIDAVRLDPEKWNIQVDMTPVTQTNPGAMADAAMNVLGAVLETMSKSPFPWQTIKFRIRGEINHILQYQFTYSRDEITDRNFELLHMNGLLYRPIHTADLQIGTKGILLDVKIMNIIDENNMIVWLDESDGNIDDIVRPVWIRGINTTGKVDESNCDITTPLMVTKTARYLTVAGNYKTIYMLEPTGFNQNAVVGDYYDNNKLVALAQDIWLNSSIDHLQGRAALADFYIRRPEIQPGELFNTLRIGGYARSDGSTCPVTLVHTPHPVSSAEPNAPTNRPQPIPLYRNTSPLITNRPPPPGF